MSTAVPLRRSRSSSDRSLAWCLHDSLLIVDDDPYLGRSFERGSSTKSCLPGSHWTSSPPNGREFRPRDPDRLQPEYGRRWRSCAPRLAPPRLSSCRSYEDTQCSASWAPFRLMLRTRRAAGARRSLAPCFGERSPTIAAAAAPSCRALALLRYRSTARWARGPSSSGCPTR